MQKVQKFVGGLKKVKILGERLDVSVTSRASGSTFEGVEDAVESDETRARRRRYRHLLWYTRDG